MDTNKFIELLLFMHMIQLIEMADNHMHLTSKEPNSKNTSFLNQNPQIVDYVNKDVELHCPSNKECSSLGAQCLNCNLNLSCNYGEELLAKCSVSPGVECKGEHTFTKTYICQYCYQTDGWTHVCDLKANCNSIATTRSPYVTNCTVPEDVLCLGHRTFNKNILCNWTGGYRWSTALILSITLGGFGADRFYLGHWQEGIGKLFSFGGLGVWTLIDVILISLHYLGPADGSLYI